MKKLLFLISMTFAFATNAQTVNTFEQFNLAADTFNNGSDFNQGFTTESLYLPNSYDTVGGYVSWGGFAISTMTDTTTAGYTNQYAVSSGSGYDNSATYALFYQGYSLPNVLKLNDTTSNDRFESMYVNNNTYAYLSMKNGDAFAKKFGGASGDDPDYFLLTIKKYENGVLGTDSIDFYLADFRSSDNSQDYIINEWTKIDLTSLGKADSLTFTLRSSDVGQFGMNTPAYFCLDQVKTINSPVAVHNLLDETIVRLFPNPTVDKLFISVDNTKASVQIFNALGQCVLPTQNFENSIEINTTKLPKGVYFAHIKSDKNTQIKQSFVKK